MATKEVPIPAQAVQNDVVTKKTAKYSSERRHSRADSMTSLYGTSANGYEMDVQMSDMLKQATSSVTSKLEGHEVWSQGTYVESIDAFLDYVAANRLRNMPHKGSKWDKILLQSVFFTSQVHHFEEAARDILTDSAKAASIIYGCVHAMLEMNTAPTASLEHAFAVLYDKSFWLTFFLRNGRNVTITEKVQQALGSIFSELVVLVVNMTLYYTNADAAGSASDSTQFQKLFGQTVISLESYKDYLINEIWTVQMEQIKSSEETAYDINELRRLLSPYDHTTAFLLFKSVSTRLMRQEFTCEWFDSHLMYFMRSKDNNLLVTGKAGSGKSVLTDWIVERLQRLHGAKATDVVTYKIQPDLVSETTSSSVAKGLLLQLLDYNIGDLQMLKFLNMALDMTSVGSPAADLEDVLWKAVGAGVSYQKNVTLVIDGLDHLSGGEVARSKLLDRLRQTSAKNANVKTIVLSCPLSKSPQDTNFFEIQPKHVQDDIKVVVRSLLDSTPEMATLKPDERAKIVEQVALPADGSFVWAIITLATIKKQNTVSAILKSLETTTRDLDSALERLVFSQDLTNTDTRSILAWMLSVERPMHLTEIQTFLELKPADSGHVPRLSNIEDDVRQAVGDLVTIQDGYVRFLHDSLRTYLLDVAGSVTDLSNSGKFPFMLKEAHFDVATRCMNYLKVFSPRQADPSVKPVGPGTIDQLFHGSPLLEYCLRYWAIHFEHSPMYQSNGQHKLVPTFKKNFTNSVFVSLLESSCWEEQFPATRLTKTHNSVLILRQTILGKEDPAVLQTLITLALLYTKFDDTKKASDTFYEAYELSIKLLGRQNKVVFDCAVGFLNVTRISKGSSRTELVTRRETILQFVIDSLKTSHSSSTDDIIRYSTMLAEMYTAIKEQDKAVIIWREIYEMSTEYYGSFDQETTKTYSLLVNTLQTLGRHEEVAKLQRYTYDRARKTLTVHDQRRKDLATSLTKYYESTNDSTAAEEIMVDEWQLISKAAETEENSALHAEKLTLSVQYAQFLQRQERTAEAQTIMRGTWSEYESRSDLRESEEIMTSFTTMAEDMKNMGMVDTAQSVLLSVWNECKVASQETALTQQVAKQLFQTTKQIMETRQTTSTTTTITSIQESIMEDIVQSTMTSTQSDSMESSFSTCESLSIMYLNQQRWDDAIRVCTQFLQVHWPSVLQQKTTTRITLPSKMQEENVTVATRLAECYFNAGATPESEHLLYNVFQATKNTLSPTDEKILSASTTLIKLHETTHQFEKASGIYAELYHLFKERLGATSPAAIHAAYTCARYCLAHGQRKQAVQHYHDVFTSVSKLSEPLPEEVLEAAQWLEEHYTRERRWKEARPIYAALFLTFVQRGKQYQMTSEYVNKFFTTYFKALKEPYNASYDDRRQVAVQYRNACVTVYGQTDEIAIRATLELAKIDEENEKHIKEAITLHKEILAHVEKIKSTTSISSTLIAIVRESKQRLAHLYSSNTTTSKEAITIISEEYQQSITQFGYAHTTTLERLQQFVTTLSKQETKESRTQIVHLLETATTHIISTEKDSQRMFESATVIAKLYLQTHHKDSAIHFLSTLRRHIIFGERSKDLKITINKADRNPYAFVAAFETTLLSQRQFSQILSEMITETMRYEAYHKAVQEKASFEVVCTRGSQLLEFLQVIQRKDEYNKIRKDLLEVFRTALSAGHNKQLQVFFDTVISEFGKNQYGSIALNIVVDSVAAHTEASRFQEAHDIAYLEYQFMTLHDELVAAENVEQGLKLGLYLAGRSTKQCQDTKLQQQMLSLSRDILTLVLAAGRKLKIQFRSMTLPDCNMLAGLLGMQHLYGDLEGLLSDLWTSRHVQQTWSSSTIVCIGKRLVEVRFAAGHTEAALHLCQDIIYNLRRVWGELDQTTLSMWQLLSELQTAAGNLHAAQNVHEEVLRSVLTAVEDGDIEVDQGAAIAVSQFERLKRTFQRSGSWVKDASVYKDLHAQLNTEFGKEKVWTASTVAKSNMAKWTEDKQQSDAVGIWKEPTSWEFAAAEEVGKHQNNLRKISGLFTSNGASGGYANGSSKSSKSYGSELTQSKVVAI
ncbi:hypothetical protein MBLNU459_g1933t1 [Dothideomycetes sp. NU459]